MMTSHWIGAWSGFYFPSQVSTSLSPIISKNKVDPIINFIRESGFVSQHFAFIVLKETPIE